MACGVINIGAVLLAFMCCVQSTLSVCPSQCACSHGEMGSVVDCSSRNLQQLPDLTHVQLPIQKLNVSHNRIQSIPLHYFENQPNISEIILDENEIAELNANSFNGLGPVQLLSLKRNKLSSIDSYSFKDISGSCNPDELFDACVLDVTQNPVEYVDAYAFAYAKNINIFLGRSEQQLTIEPYAFYGVNQIPWIHLTEVPELILKAGAFTNAEKVQKLEISNTKVSSIPKFTFEGMIHVSTIHMHHSNLLDIQDYGFAGIHYQPKPEPEVPMMASNDKDSIGYANDQQVSYDKAGGIVQIETCQINVLPADCFRDTNLAELYLKSNNILNIKEHFLRGATRLHIVNMTENMMPALKAKSLGCSNALKQLHLIRNDLKDIHRAAFEGLENVDALIINVKSGTHLTLHQGAFSGAHDIRTLKISGEKSTPLASMSVAEDAFQNLFGVQNLDIANLNLPTLTQGSFRGMGKIHVLRFVFCNIRRIEPNTFSPGYYGRGAVDHLDLSQGNNLQCDCELSRLLEEFKDVFLNVSLVCSQPHSGVQHNALYSARTHDLTQWPVCPESASASSSCYSSWTVYSRVLVASLVGLFLLYNR